MSNCECMKPIFSIDEIQLRLFFWYAHIFSVCASICKSYRDKKIKRTRWNSSGKSQTDLFLLKGSASFFFDTFATFFLLLAYKCALA